MAKDQNRLAYLYMFTDHSIAATCLHFDGEALISSPDVQLSSTHGYLTKNTKQMGEVGHGISCSQVLCFPDFYTGNKKVAVSKDCTLEPIFKKFLGRQQAVVM